MTQDTYDQLVLLLAGSALTMIGAFVGQYFSQRNAERTTRLQRLQDLQHRSYAKLTGLKVPWSQVVQAHLEAALLSEFYDLHYQLFSHDPNDLAEAKRQNDRALSLISQFSTVQREVFEALADARIAYEPTPQLTAALDSLYQYEGLALAVVDRARFRTPSDLDLWKQELAREIAARSKAGFADRVEIVLSQLLQQLRAA